MNVLCESHLPVSVMCNCGVCIKDVFVWHFVLIIDYLADVYK